MKKILLLTAAFVLMATLVFSGCASDDKGIIGSVNGLPVYQEELDVYISKNRAAVGAVLAEKFSIASFGEEFWTTNYDGIIPEDVLKEKALEGLVEDKVIQYMAVSRGIVAPGDFNQLKKVLVQEQEKTENSPTTTLSFGPEEYEISQFLAYQMTQTKDDIKTFLIEKEFSPTETELKEAFNSLPEEIKRTHFAVAGLAGSDYSENGLSWADLEGEPYKTTYPPEYADYLWEEFFFESAEIHREDIYNLGLAEALYSAKPNSFLVYGDTVCFVKNKTGGQPLTYEQSGDLGRNKWINDKFDQLVAEEILKAEIVWD